MRLLPAFDLAAQLGVRLSRARKVFLVARRLALQFGLELAHAAALLLQLGGGAAALLLQLGGDAVALPSDFGGLLLQLAVPRRPRFDIRVERIALLGQGGARAVGFGHTRLGSALRRL